MIDMAQIHGDYEYQLYEPSPRYLHYAGSVNGQLCVWGGITEEFLLSQTNSVSPFIYNYVDTFDPYLEVWMRLPSGGTQPPGLYAGASAAAGDFLYVYGGYDGQERHGSLHSFNIKTCTWKLLSAHTPDGPRKKVGCGMLYYEHKLILFGGSSNPTGNIQPGALYNGRLTNELHVFDLEEGNWYNSLFLHSQHVVNSGYDCKHMIDFVSCPANQMV